MDLARTQILLVGPVASPLVHQAKAQSETSVQASHPSQVIGVSPVKTDKDVKRSF